MDGEPNRESDLDAFLGRPPVSAAHTEREHRDDPWLEMAKSDPSIWRKRGNPITDRVAASIAADAEVDLEGQAGRYCRQAASFLLTEADGDELLLLKAQENCRRNRRWRGLDPWIQRASLVTEMARIRAARRQVGELLQEGTAEEPMIECPKCGKWVYPERVEDDCNGH